jgi:quinol monooxygenase YgiN
MKRTMNVFYSTFRLFLAAIILVCWAYASGCGQSKEPYVRVAALEVDPQQLDGFKAALKEDIEAAVRNEPGVISLYAAYDQASPNRITIFEVYINQQAHQAHQQTPHFLKYKSATQGMVRSTIRTEMSPITLAVKPQKP